MSAATDWEKRYRSLVEQHRVDEAEHAEIKALLSRIIIRLTLAAEGCHPDLDHHLKRLREVVRQGVSPSLKVHLDELSDTLMRVSGGSSQPSDIVRFIDRLVDIARLPAKQAKALRRLANELSKRPLQEADDQDIERFFSILCRAQPSDAGKQGLLTRVFGRGEKGGGGDPNQELAKLLEESKWPAHWDADIARLRQDLTATDAKPTTWREVISELVEMILNAMGNVETELRETEGFLSTLTEHLNDLDQSLQGGEQSRKSALESSHAMSEQVNAEVGGIAASVSSSQDLMQLKQSVAGRLKVIKSAVDRHLMEYEERIRQDEAREKELRRRLDSVEREAHELRSRMMHARHQALVDAVTDLPNRMAWDERLAQEYGRWRRFGEPLTLVVWDMDDFKQVNDRFGHQAGDKALRAVANKFRQRLKETDFVARFGGEEFAMLFVGTDVKGALVVAEDLRKGVEGAGFHAGPKPVQLTVSCGISEFKEGDDPESVFERADKALYKAKAEGKNRCIVA